MRDEFGRFTGMFVIITFDIIESPSISAMQKRLRDINKVLKGYGQRAQKSVFEAYLDNTQMETLKTKLTKVVNIALGDNVRMYKVCNSCFEKIEVIGEQGVSPEEEVYIF